MLISRLIPCFRLHIVSKLARQRKVMVVAVAGRRHAILPHSDKGTSGQPKTLILTVVSLAM